MSAGTMQLEYWTAFNNVLGSMEGPLTASKHPVPKPWMIYRVGRSNIQLSVRMYRKEQAISAEVFMRGGNAEAFFNILMSQKQELETELGYELEWEELLYSRGGRSYVLLAVDVGDKSDWARQHRWLAEHINELYRVFVPRIRKLNAEDWYSGAPGRRPPP